MKNFVSLGLVICALPVLSAACGTETIVKKGPDSTEPAPTDPGPNPGEMMPGEEMPAGPDACACPATCKSTTEPTKVVCHPAAPPKTLPESSTIGKFVITGF